MTIRFVADSSGDEAMRREAEDLIGEARPFMHSPGRVVVRDIDETVKPHSEKTHRGPVSPGALALFSALDAGRDGSDSRDDIHFVTARDGVVVHAGHTLNDTAIDVGSISYGTTWSLLRAGVGVFSPPLDISGHANIVVFSDDADAAHQLLARGTISAAQHGAVLADVAAAASRG